MSAPVPQTIIVDDDRVTRVARALCLVDGQDPNATIVIRAVEEVATEFGIMAEVPAWRSYAREARRLVAGMIALGIIE